VVGHDGDNPLCILLGEPLFLVDLNHLVQLTWAG
jgi:hypothetical protein